MKEINSIVLEDGKDYMILDTLVISENRYLVLSKIEDSRDFCIRKLLDDGTLIGLSDKTEFDKVALYYLKKHGNN